MRHRLMVVLALAPLSSMACQQVAPDATPPAAEVKTPQKDAPAPDGACTPTQVQKGEKLHRTQCIACHSTDGTRLVGPTFKDLYFKERQLQGKTEPVIADDEYLMRSLTEPNLDIVEGFVPAMPPSKHVPTDQDAMLCFVKSLTDKATVEARRNQKKPPPKTPPKTPVPAPTK